MHSVFKPLLLTLMLLLCTVAPARAELLNKIVAVVNGDMVSLYELQAAAAPDFLRAGINRAEPRNADKVRQIYLNTLDSMIADILVTQEAERLQIEVSAEEVENELRVMIQRSQMTPAAFEQQARSQGVTLDAIRDRIRKNILSSRLTAIMITRKIVLTQDEIRQYYEENQAMFARDRSVEIGMLVLSAEQDAPAVLREIRGGQITFEQAVTQWSKGPNPDKGGNIGTLTWKDLAPEWKKTLQSVEKGDVSEILTMPDGTRAILKVVDIIPGSTMSIEDATPEIEARLREPKLAQRQQEYIKQLRDKAVIDIRL